MNALGPAANTFMWSTTVSRNFEAGHVGPNCIQVGNAEIELSLVLRLAALAGPIGEDDEDPSALFFRFERPSYTRDEVLEIAQIINGLRPDECGISEGDLRLWWD